MTSGVDEVASFGAGLGSGVSGKLLPKPRDPAPSGKMAKQLWDDALRDHAGPVGPRMVPGGGKAPKGGKSPDGGGDAAGKGATPDDVASTAAKGFKNFRCKECADAIVKAMKEKGYCGEIIDIQARGNRPLIYSDRAGKVISEDGTHRAVRIGDTVFDNHNPNGLSFDDWVNDLNTVYGFDIIVTHF